MKEIERIIKSGILPESFFEEEVICDFKVDLARKKLWAISLDLLFKFDEVCRKHHIKYMLAYGSLLGIIRHKGFIPWDDDIDIIMPRPDFERFCSEYHSVNGYTFYRPEDSKNFMPFARVCDNARTYVKTNHPWSNERTGIWIDIMPIDGLPDEKEEFFEHVKKIRKIQKKVYRLRTGRYLKLSDTIGIKNIFVCLIKIVINCEVNL